MNIEKYKNKGLSGLGNLGNTCFINSTMQILSHTYEFNELLNSETFKRKIMIDIFDRVPLDLNNIICHSGGAVGSDFFLRLLVKNSE